MMTNQSFDISEKDIKKCIEKGVIPKKIAELFFKNTESSLLQNTDAVKTRAQEFTILADFIVKNMDKIVYCSANKKSQTFRVTRDIVDSKFSRDAQPSASPISQATLYSPCLELTEAEDKILLVLFQLLAKNSEQFDQSSSDYYMGNFEKGVVNIEGVEMQTAALRTTPHEIYKTYLGRSNYGSDNSRHLWSVLISLAKKQFLVTITYSNPYQQKKKSQKFLSVRLFAPLFHLYILNQGLTEKDACRLNAEQGVPEGNGCKLLFKFNPIFTQTIRERYVEYPIDVHLAADIVPSNQKSKRKSQCIHRMRDLLFREKQFKRYLVERDEKTLIRDLGLEKMRVAGRKNRVREQIKKALIIWNEAGLVESWETVLGAKGQTKYSIRIDKHFK